MRIPSNPRHATQTRDPFSFFLPALTGRGGEVSRARREGLFGGDRRCSHSSRGRSPNRASGGSAAAAAAMAADANGDAIPPLSSAAAAVVRRCARFVRIVRSDVVVVAAGTPGRTSSF
jgi:hypothetical protein